MAAPRLWRGMPAGFLAGFLLPVAMGQKENKENTTAFGIIFPLASDS